MTTFYLDPEGGNDANAGTSFALRWKSFTLGATAARTAPGDTIRIIGSPAPTSLGSATWKSTDTTPVQVNLQPASSTNAAPIVVTTTAPHGLSNGDTVVIRNHTINTRANGTWEVANVTSTTVELVGSTGNGTGGLSGQMHKAYPVVLGSPVTQAIACVGNRGTLTNWTASANVTCVVDTTLYKEGAECQRITLASGFTTGKAAYLPIGPLDLSGYNQITFWFHQASGAIGAAGQLSIKLCSDAVGAVPVDSFDIPAIAASSLNTWYAFTVDKGASLGSAIASIALYVNTDIGAQVFYLDCITAVKDPAADDSLSLTSLIGQNVSGQPWRAIQSINGTRVMLAAANNITGDTPQGYTGPDGSITTYKRETLKVTPIGTGEANTTQEAGTSGNPITYSGGWNRTDMSTQSLETWLDGQNGLGTGIRANQTFLAFDKVHVCRYSTGVYLSASDLSVGDIQATACGSTGIAIGNSSSRIDVGSIISTGNTVSNVVLSASLLTVASIISKNGGLTALSVVGSAVDIGTIDAQAYGVTAGSISLTGSNIVVGEISMRGVMANTAVSVSGNSITIKELEIVGHGTGSQTALNVGTSTNVTILSGSSSGHSICTAVGTTGDVTLRNFTILDTVEVSTNGVANGDGRITSENHDATPGNHQIFMNGGRISANTSVRHTASGISWALQPTSALRTSFLPLRLPIAQVAVKAGALVTAAAWFQRDNTGLSMNLVCRGGQLTGISSDVTAAITAAANTWEQLTITFTPSEDGVVEIEAQAYGGITYTGYVDDFTVSQA